MNKLLLGLTFGSLLKGAYASSCAGNYLDAQKGPIKKSATVTARSGCAPLPVDMFFFIR